MCLKSLKDSREEVNNFPACVDALGIFQYYAVSDLDARQVERIPLAQIQTVSLLDSSL